jgi:hypothetical protein
LRGDLDLWFISVKYCRLAQCSSSARARVRIQTWTALETDDLPSLALAGGASLPLLWESESVTRRHVQQDEALCAYYSNPGEHHFDAIQLMIRLVMAGSVMAGSVMAGIPSRLPADGRRATRAA